MSDSLSKLAPLVVVAVVAYVVLSAPRVETASAPLSVERQQAASALAQADARIAQATASAVADATRTARSATATASALNVESKQLELSLTRAAATSTASYAQAQATISASATADAAYIARERELAALEVERKRSIAEQAAQDASIAESRARVEWSSKRAALFEFALPVALAALALVAVACAVLLAYRHIDGTLATRTLGEQVRQARGYYVVTPRGLWHLSARPSKSTRFLAPDAYSDADVVDAPAIAPPYDAPDVESVVEPTLERSVETVLALRLLKESERSLGAASTFVKAASFCSLSGEEWTRAVRSLSPYVKTTRGAPRVGEPSRTVVTGAGGYKSVGELLVAVERGDVVPVPTPAKPGKGGAHASESAAPTHPARSIA